MSSSAFLNSNVPPANSSSQDRKVAITAEHQQLSQIELQKSQRLDFVPGGSSLEEIYLKGVVEGNSRLALALSSVQLTSTLESIRNATFLGEFSEAKLKLDFLATLDLSASVRAEELTARARIACYEDQWLLTTQLIAQAIELQPQAVTLTTLFQIRAIAHYESGKWSECFDDLRQIEMLAAYLPKATATFFAKLIQIKCEAEIKSPKLCLQSLDSLIRREDLRIREQPVFAMAAFRCRLELLRRAGTPHVREARIAMNLAERTGSSFFKAGAQLDLWVAGGGKDTELKQELISLHSRRFRRINETLLSLESDAQPNKTIPSETVKSMKQYLEHAKIPSELPETVPVADIEWIDLRWRWRSSTAGAKILSLDPPAQLRHALEILSIQGELPLEAFFRKVWNRRGYSPNLHDRVIHALLHRLRTKHDLPAGVRNGKVGLPMHWITAAGDL